MAAPLIVTPFTVALRFVGLRETPGIVHSPAIVSMLQLVDRSVRDDETPWCSAFVNYIAWLLGLPRSNSLAARSWLRVGEEIPLSAARAGSDVVILRRGDSTAPASVIAAPGHVGFFVSWDQAAHKVRVLGGNQGNAVTMADFEEARVLGVRRLV